MKSQVEISFLSNNLILEQGNRAVFGALLPVQRARPDAAGLGRHGARAGAEHGQPRRARAAAHTQRGALAAAAASHHLLLDAGRRWICTPQVLLLPDEGLKKKKVSIPRNIIPRNLQNYNYYQK